jgi:pimeloyl-ACP methyl ester carboxylesterase
MGNERASWRSPALGEARSIELPTCTLRYHERGVGDPMVFVHGLLVNANLWRKVVPALAPDFRCIALDLPLGSHLDPAPGAEMTLIGVADLIADALEALDLDRVTLVANDTGGAIAQVLVTRRPERIGRLVLTSCDAFDNFLPPMFMPLAKAARVPGLLLEVATALRLRPLRRLPMAFGWLSKRPVEAEASDSYVLPVATIAGVRADARRFLRAVDSRYTIEAAQRLPAFDRPVLLAWSREDRFFPPSDAERLAELLPDSRLEWIDDAYTFSMEDQPERLAELVSAFAREPVGAEGAAR